MCNVIYRVCLSIDATVITVSYTVKAAVSLYSSENHIKIEKKYEMKNMKYEMLTDQCNSLVLFLDPLHLGKN